MIHQPLLASGSRTKPGREVDSEARAELKGQKPAIYWFTAPTGSNPSALARRVEQKLYGLGRHTQLLEATRLRRGLNRDLDGNASAGSEEIRRLAEMAAICADAGLIVLVSLPAAEEGSVRFAADDVLGADRYTEIRVGSEETIRNPDALEEQAERIVEELFRQQ
jgi:bifunctional enzyme CysN/CysC